MIAEQAASHLPKPSPAMPVLCSEEDLQALKAAFIRRFDEDLPRTETLMAVSVIGYRMALRDFARTDPAHTALVAALEYVRENLGEPVPVGKRHIARKIDEALALVGAGK